jgi:hypothetical protein
VGKKENTLQAVLADPVRANIRWADIEHLLKGLGATVSERRGSRIAVVLNGVVAVFHRPHPSPQASRAQVRSVREFLRNAGVVS